MLKPVPDHPLPPPPALHLCRQICITYMDPPQVLKIHAQNFQCPKGLLPPLALIFWPVDQQRLSTTRSWPLVPVSTRPASLSRSECTGRQAYYTNLWRSKPEEFLIIEHFPRASPNPFNSHSEEINNIPRHMSASYLCDHRNTDASGAECLFQMSKENSNNPMASSESFVAT